MSFGRLVYLGVCLWKHLHSLAFIACGYELFYLFRDLAYRIAMSDVKNALVL